MNLFNLDDVSRRIPAPHLIGDGRQGRGRLLMSFDTQAPLVRFHFHVGDQVDVTRLNSDHLVEFLGRGMGSTRQFNDVGLVGPHGSDSDVVERVIVGPTTEHDEPEEVPSDV